MRSFLRKLSWRIWRNQKEAELQEEIRFHLEEEAEERRDMSASGDAARLAARRDLGNVARVHEETRAAWGWTVAEQFAQDVRYAFRTMLASKSFSALAILSLALGIGANTAIFSLMDAMLLRSLPVYEPESLVRFTWHTREDRMHGTDRHDDSHYDAANGLTAGFFSYPAFEIFRAHSDLFSTVFGYQGTGDLHLAFGDQAEVVHGEYVTGDYFSGLGVPPAAGRLIAPDDDRAGAASVAVISYALSERRFGGPANAAGRSVLIRNLPFTVIGVAAPEFFGADPGASPDVYVPLHANILFDSHDRFHPPASLYVNPGYDWIVPMARLRPGVALARAQAVLGPQFAEFERTLDTELTRSDPARLSIEEGAKGLDSLRHTYSKPLFLLLSLAGLILAIACANIANLLLARAAARRREIAVRLSMGAGRARIIRQLLTESVAMAILGAALGVAFAIWGVRVLRLLVESGREGFTVQANLNWHTLAVAAALALVTGAVFGLAPALEATRADLLPALKESRTGSVGDRGRRRITLSRLLTVAQIAVSLMILAAAALFARTLSNFQSIQLGFNQENVLTFNLDARQAGHNDPEIFGFYERLRSRFASVPGVRAATFSYHALIGAGSSMTMVAAGRPAPDSSLVMTVGPNFFGTMQIPILLGREIGQRELGGPPWEVVVNEAFAKKYLDGASPLGSRLQMDYECPKCAIEVVGVCGNAHYGRWWQDVEPAVYLPFTFALWGPVSGMTFELRTAGNPLNYARTVREIVHEADARLPVDKIRTQTELIDSTISREIAFARLSSAFAFLALVIACVGLYGSVSYGVARRAGEIGIRMALGAQRKSVLWMVLREVLLVAFAGLAIGVPCALAASGVVKSFVFGIEANDPLAFSSAAAILLCAAALAAFVPARKASRMDPMTALRHE